MGVMEFTKDPEVTVDEALVLLCVTTFGLLWQVTLGADLGGGATGGISSKTNDISGVKSFLLTLAFWEPDILLGFEKELEFLPVIVCRRSKFLRLTEQLIFAVICFGFQIGGAGGEIFGTSTLMGISLYLISAVPDGATNSTVVTMGGGHGLDGCWMLRKEFILLGLHIEKFEVRGLAQGDIVKIFAFINC